MTVDKHAARELELYFENDGDIHRQRVVPIQENLRKKIAKRTFEAVKSIDLWVYAVDDAAKKYAKEFGGTWHKLFSPQTRRFVAVRAALQFMEDEGLPVSKDDWKRVSLDDGSMNNVGLGGTSTSAEVWLNVSSRSIEVAVVGLDSRELQSADANLKHAAEEAGARIQDENPQGVPVSGDLSYTGFTAFYEPDGIRDLVKTLTKEAKTMHWIGRVMAGRGWPSDNRAFGEIGHRDAVHTFKDEKSAKIFARENDRLVASVYVNHRYVFAVGNRVQLERFGVGDSQFLPL